MQYRSKPKIVEAEQFNENTYLHSEFLSELIVDKATFIDIYSTKCAADGRYHINADNGFVEIHNGLYIVRKISGEIVVKQAKYFESEYELVT
ncbi:hypothetical protein AAGS61_05885 [Lysinibacillus sp. KU-BSD001]|uniref:hypothetical protein n=1 Tax=Lysinibacillus sp. KU-BSD001 TaxID=3141328 RepID=UPI0036EC752C